MGDPYDAILLIDKSEGETSFATVGKVRRLLKVKKAGHAGTLDPFATGLLVVLLGQGTKLSPYLMQTEKNYLATVRLGVSTDTQDPTGRIVETRPVTGIDAQIIRATALDFVGKIEQVPPMYSAIKIKGRRAYELARRGINVALEKREISIFSLKIVSIDLPDVTMDVTCSSGTYIRTLAADLGARLGTGAHLKALRRVWSGPFSVKDAVNLKAIGSNSAEEILRDKIVPLREALPHLEEVQVDDPTAKKIRNGYQPPWPLPTIEKDAPQFRGGHMKLVNDNRLVAIAHVCMQGEAEKKTLKVARVFH